VGAAEGVRAAIGLGLITALLLLGAGGVPPIAAGGTPVTLEAAALIGLCYYLSQSAWLAGTGYWTLYRPLVAGLLAGAILGDPWTGATVGALVNIAFLGFLGTGAALPTDMALVGYASAAIALATGLGATASLALGAPLGLLGYGLYRVRLRWCNATARRAVRYARRGDVQGVGRCNVLAPQSMLLFLAWAPATVAVYLAAMAARGVTAAAPSWVIAWLHLTGVLLVALGAASGLALLWTRRTSACYLGGFVAAIAATGPETALLAGLLGAAGAASLPWLARERPMAEERPVGGRPQAALRQGGQPRGEAVRGAPVRARDRLASLLRWVFFSHAGYSEDRLQGVGLAHAMAPILHRLYPTRSELASALGRYMAPFNVEPNLGSAVLGVLAHQEEALARGQTAPSAPEETRARLAGPVSGVGDTVIHGAIGTVAMAVGVAVTSVVGPAGAVAYAALMAATVWGVSAWAYRRGYRGGFPGVLEVLRSSAWRRVVVGAECAGSIIFGVLTAGPIAGLLAGAAGGIGDGTWMVRALAALPAMALVGAFLALQRWGVRQAWATAGCYGIGLVVALLRLM